MAYKFPTLTGETAAVSAGDAAVIELPSTAIELSGITLRTFAEAAADGNTDFDDGDTVDVTVIKDPTNWRRASAVYDATAGELTCTWAETKGTIGVGDSVSVHVNLTEDHNSYTGAQGGSATELYHSTSAEYSALQAWAPKAVPTGTVVGTTDTQSMSGKTYSYDNTVSGLTATDHKAAIDELDAALDLFTDPILDKASPGNIGSVAPGIGNFSDLFVDEPALLASGLRVGTGTNTYAPGVIGYTDVDWGYLHRPPRVGLDGAHGFQSYAGVDLVTIEDGGDVGIGTDSPAAKLHVTGGDLTVEDVSPVLNLIDSDALDSDDYVGYLHFEDSLGAQAGYMGFPSASDSDLLVYNDSAAGDVRIATDGTTRLTVDHLGRIGINDISPTKLVDIKSTANNSSVVAVQNASSNDIFRIVDDASGDGVVYVEDSSSVVQVAIHSNADSYFNGGDVAIGGTSPDSELHVYGNITMEDDDPILNIIDSNASTQTQVAARVSLATSGGTRAGWFGLGYSTNPNMYVQNDTAGGAVRIATQSSTRMVVLSTGDVGIGDNTPSYQLELSTNDAAKPTSSLWTVSSDLELKGNIVPADLSRCWEIAKGIPLIHFNYKEGVFKEGTLNDKSKLGFGAQHVEPFFPHSVTYRTKKLADGTVRNLSMGLDPEQIIMADHGALQLAIQKIEALEEQVAELIQELAK